jgi:predicted DCC family thiol-disulfide oxidoreductase YuxK
MISLNSMQASGGTAMRQTGTCANPAFPLVIYYDGSCPLCTAEMRVLSDSDPDALLQWIDCSAPDFHDRAAAAAGISASALMRQIHARDATAQWYRGIDALALAYRAVGFETVARLWSLRGLRPVWDRLYLRVARHRSLLSRLHLDAVFRWWLRRAAREAQRRMRACDAQSKPACGRPPVD